MYPHRGLDVSLCATLGVWGLVRSIYLIFTMCCVTKPGCMTSRNHLCNEKSSFGFLYVVCLAISHVCYLDSASQNLCVKSKQSVQVACNYGDQESHPNNVSFGPHGTIAFKFCEVSISICSVVPNTALSRTESRWFLWQIRYNLTLQIFSGNSFWEENVYF